VFPSGARSDLLDSHFIGEATLPLLQAATEELPTREAAAVYERFVQAREAAMIDEIRRVCGIVAIPAGARAEAEADEVAADIQADSAQTDDELVLADL